MSSKRKFIIDTDAGNDDAQAIFMALAAPDVHVLGITTVGGNAVAAQVGRNVLRVLQQTHRLQIPVYVGCNEPLLGDKKPSSPYHGSDGFGDVPDPNAPDASYIQLEHAVQTLLRVSREHSGEVSLVCLGPLTNIAVALRLDSLFGRRLKHCYIMGGNCQGRGNMTTSAEFNFYADPEAAFVVLNQLDCPITLVPWEVCYKHSITWDFYRKFREIRTPVSEFMKRIEQKSIEYSHSQNWTRYVPADELLMAVALKNDVIIEKRHVFATVEVKGHFTWGQMIVDWTNYLNKKPNITLVTNIEDKKYIDLMFMAMGANPV